MPPGSRAAASNVREDRYRLAEHANNLLRGELKRRGLTYAQLAEKLAEIGVSENERNLNKISRGGFTDAFLIQCLEAMGAETVRLG